MGGSDLVYQDPRNFYWQVQVELQLHLFAFAVVELYRVASLVFQLIGWPYQNKCIT